jgi:hypothetical protein
MASPLSSCGKPPKLLESHRARPGKGESAPVRNHPEANQKYHTSYDNR